MGQLLKSPKVEMESVLIVTMVLFVIASVAPKGVVQKELRINSIPMRGGPGLEKYTYVYGVRHNQAFPIDKAIFRLACNGGLNVQNFHKSRAA
jgi:hypothetical protein